MRDHLLGRRTSPPTGLRVGVAEEEVAGERHLFAERPAEQVAGADAEFLPDHVDAGKFHRRVELGPVVIEAGRSGS